MVHGVTSVFRMFVNGMSPTRYKTGEQPGLNLLLGEDISFASSFVHFIY